MAGVGTSLALVRRVSLAALVVAGLVLAPRAHAIEALDGRVQLHGYTEVQVRALDEKFSQELDLAQWYNVLNVELEFDVAPEGFGPIDVLSAYIRVEGRYDAIYSHGFGMFPSINTYGNFAEDLPKRLRDSKSVEMGGVIPATDAFGAYKNSRIANRDPAVMEPPVMHIPPQNIDPNPDLDPGPGVRLQFPNGINAAKGGPDELPVDGRKANQGVHHTYPGFDLFFKQAGPDDVLGTADDPARYVQQHIADFAFTFKEIRGPINANTMIMGPWLPKNFIRAVALNPDIGNPFRGRVAPTQPLRFGLPTLFDPTAPLGPASLTAIRYNEADVFLGNITAILPTPAPGAGPNFAVVDLLDPVMAKVLTAPDNVLLDLRGAPVLSAPGGAVPLALSATFPGRFTANPFSPTGLVPSPDLTNDFGGDFMAGVVPCQDPTSDLSQLVRAGKAPADPLAQCIESASTGGGPGTPGNGGTDPGAPAGSFEPPGLTKMTGGKGETPFRPAPDLPNLGSRLIARDSTGAIVDLGVIQNQNSKLTEAQGLYIPSKGLIRTLDSGRLDSLQFNFDQVDRSFNRGQSQENNKELKEAYFDVEVLDSRLWMRLGLQNIVWGKTELFRTTDQFNPQDLALASLPSLEESRIALWSARFVYSLYDIGPLEDVRLEFATNIDQYQPSDLGACGEPYTPDIVCALTNGIVAHSLLGVGVAGIDRPEAPWKNIKDLEFGGRAEWRWDRFSFALVDFWGFSDFPNVDPIYFYDRNVDVDTGRPLIGALPNQAPGKCGAFAGEPVQNRLNAGGLVYNSSFASHPFSVTPGGPVLLPPLTIENRRGGVGRDHDCLRPGGAPGSANAFAFDTPEDDLAHTNALQNHYANQQIFAWVCANTVGIAAALDAGSCAWTIFATDAVLNRQLLPISFVESLTALMAGEQTGGSGPQQFMGLIANNQKGAVLGASLAPVPLASLNRLFNNPQAPFDANGDGVVDTSNCGVATDLVHCDLAGFDGFDGRVQIPGRAPPTPGAGAAVANFITLDSSLTNEQRALLGCGPFFASRCDSSLSFRDNTKDIYWGNFGGLDFMNMEASALVQSWIGIEGTVKGDFSTSDKRQPGTVGFVPVMNEQDGQFEGIGGPICTRFVMDRNQEVKLPGCRGVKSLQVIQVAGNPVLLVDFESGYMPSIDGCVIGSHIRRTNGSLVNVELTGASQANAQLRTQLDLCSGALTKKVVPRTIFVDANNDGKPDLNPNGTPIVVNNPACQGNPIGAIVDGEVLRVCDSQQVTLEQLPLIHPVAGCVSSPAHFNVYGAADCRYWMNRDLVEELFGGTAQLFQNELAAFSWNFLMFLTLTSCDVGSRDLNGNDHRISDNVGGPRSLIGDPQCFDPSASWDPTRCSIAAPQYCSNVKGFLTAAGVTRNTRRAGGNSEFGRRTFIWHSGGEVVLDYNQRNVLGFSADFAEDHTKTNWGVEFTYVDHVPFQDNDTMTGVADSNAYNLTISVDRPTFINFLNPNRTFFFNTQWFVSYLDKWEKGYTFDGPWNVLFTFAVFTGYFQDRVMPQFVTVFDVRSQSGGLLPSFQYRFTESFSVTIGMLYFFGHTELKDMPVRDIAPAANRSGPNAYETGVDNILALVRQRDEVFLRLRWTF